MTEVADVLSRLESTSVRREPKPWMVRGSLMPHIHVRYTECQSDYLQRGRKVLLPGGLWCTFGNKSADRPRHWISSERITHSHWPVSASNRVRTQPQHKIPNNRKRLNSLNKVGEVNILNPDREEITSNEVKQLWDQVKRFIVTIGPYPEALQRAGITREEKMKAQRDLATLKARPDEIDPIFNI